jgi:serine/threonine-protein kinase
VDKPTPGSVAYEFGAFRLEPRHRVLTYVGGPRVEIAAKAFDALLYLVEHAGTVVARDELMKALWPRTIVEDNSLNKLIAALRRALDTDEYIATLPGRGYQFIADVRVSGAQTAGTPGVAELVQESGPPARARWLWVLASALGLAIVVVGAWELRPVDSRVPPEVMRFRIDVPRGQHLYGGAPADLESRSGRQRPSRPSFALSPDGRYLVYAATDGTNARLYKRRMNEQESTAIAGSEGGTRPAFSRDSLTVAFFVGNELKRVPVEGGEVRTIAISGAAPISESTVSWTENDTVLVTAVGAGSDAAIYEVPANGGGAVRLTRLDSSVGDFIHRYAQMLPNRRGLLLNVINQDKAQTPSEWDIVIQPLDGGQRKVVVDGGGRPVYGSHPIYLASGRIVFARGGQLWAVPFDATRLEATGAPVVILEDVMHADRAVNGVLNSGAAQFSVSRTGTLAYVAGGTYPRPADSLVWLDASGKEEPLPGLPTDRYLYPRFSADGTKLVYATGVFYDLRVWTYDIELGFPQPLTAATGYLAPVWSPDAKRIAFSGSGVAGGLHWVAADGSGPIQHVIGIDGLAVAQASSWSMDDQLAFVGVPSENKRAPIGIWTMRMDGTGRRERFGPKESPTWAPSFSPDGKWIAYMSGETGGQEIWVRQFPDTGPVYRISNDGGDSPVWSRDGRHLFYVVQERPDKPLRVMAVDLATEPSFKRGPSRLLFEGPYVGCAPVRCYDISPDGKRFVAVRVGQAEPQPVTGINIVVNWPEAFTEPAAAH